MSRTRFWRSDADKSAWITKGSAKRPADAPVRIQRGARILITVLQPPAECAALTRRQAADVMPFEQNGAGSGPVNAGDGLADRCLAAPGLADDAEYFPARDRDRDAVHRAQPAGPPSPRVAKRKMRVHVLQFKDRMHHASNPWWQRTQWSGLGCADGGRAVATDLRCAEDTADGTGIPKAQPRDSGHRRECRAAAPRRTAGCPATAAYTAAPEHERTRRSARSPSPARHTSPSRDRRFPRRCRDRAWSATPTPRAQPPGCRNNIRICAWIVTSSAVVGSSAMTSRGSGSNAMAIISRWR